MAVWSWPVVAGQVQGEVGVDDLPELVVVVGEGGA